jgi:hypothetical protein
VKDLASGLLCCSIVSGYVKDSKRFVPELISFTHSVLAVFLERGLGSGHRHSQPTFNGNTLSSLRDAAACAVINAAAGDLRISWSVFSSAAVLDISTAALQIYGAVLSLLNGLVDMYKGSTESFPELFGPLLRTLLSARLTSSPAHLEQKYVQLAETMANLVKESCEKRKPLQWRTVQTKSIDMKNPRYELDYTFKKSTNPDKERFDTSFAPHSFLR